MTDFMQGDKDSAVAVPFSDDATEAAKDDELPEGEDKPNESPEERRTRKQRRHERLQTKLRTGEEALAKVKDLEERDSKREREMAELRGMVTAHQSIARAAAPEGSKDEFERRLDAVYEKQQNAYAAAQAEVASGKFDEKRSRYYETIAREIESEKSSIHAERVLSRREPAVRQEQAQQVWVQKYPEVYRDPRAFQYARATFDRRLALGEADSASLVDEVMGETMAQFRLGPKKAPSQSERARHSGIPSSGSSGGGRSDPSGITMTPELRRMAIAAYDHLPEAEAIKTWVNKAGKRLRDKKVL